MVFNMKYIKALVLTSFNEYKDLFANVLAKLRKIFAFSCWVLCEKCKK